MQPVFRHARNVLAISLALAAAPVFAQGGSPYDQTIFFGDSLTDAGFYQPFLIEQVGPSGALIGKFTTNPGQVWAQYLADYYGTNGSSAWGLTSTGVVPGTGDNYAAGGARVTLQPGYPPSPPTSFAPSMAMQINAYLAANGGRANPDALFTVWGGANDLFFHLGGATTQVQFLSTASAQVGLVSTLQGAGARYIMVATMPDVGLTPFGLSQGAAGSAGITALSSAYNQTLFGALAQNNLHVIPLNTFSLLREVVADPSAYGFANATSPACGATSSLICSPANYVTPNAADSYVFADSVHPSNRTHAILAQYAVSILEGPRQIAVLPRSAATTGRARADLVAAHVAGKPEADGMRWWSSLRGDSQRYGSGDDYDGAVPALTVGADWSRGNLVFGAFGGYGRGRIDYGRNRGRFDQSDATLGGFVGWYGDSGLWANGQLSYSKLGFDVDRDIQLGPATRRHSGSPDGKNITAAVNAGWTFGDGALRHGPVLAVVSQQIDVDGYKENQPSLSTSLAYRDQSFDSLIGSVGWQASYAINDRLAPYAKLTYDHEFEKGDEQVFANAQSLPGTLDYAVPGLAQDRNYGTVVVGARAVLFGLDADIGASATVSQGGGNNATVFMTVGSRF